MRQKLLFFLLITLSYYSQAQGFLGRKIMIKYNFHTSLAISNPTYNKAIGINASSYQYQEKESDNVSNIGLNQLHELGVDYIYNRTHSIGFFLGMTRTSLDYQYQNKQYGSALILYNPYDLRIKLYSYNFEVKWTKYYKRTGVAGLGIYRVWSIGYLNNNIYDRLELENKTISSKLNQFNGMVIGFELGKQKIYYDQFAVNIAFCMRYVSGGISAYSDLDNSTTEQDRLKYKSKIRLANQQLFTIKLGVGYLIK